MGLGLGLMLVLLRRAIRCLVGRWCVRALVVIMRVVRLNRLTVVYRRLDWVDLLRRTVLRPALL